MTKREVILHWLAAAGCLLLLVAVIYGAACDVETEQARATARAVEVFDGCRAAGHSEQYCRQVAWHALYNADDVLIRDDYTVQRLD